jgi:hypothetical protein
MERHHYHDQNVAIVYGKIGAWLWRCQGFLFWNYYPDYLTETETGPARAPVPISQSYPMETACEIGIREDFLTMGGDRYKIV